MSEKLLAEWFWTDRWIGSSAFGLPLEARGLYREMLTQSWRRGARLPNNHDQIRRMTGVTLSEWRRTWPSVERFWRVDGEILVNDTQLEIYGDAAARTDKASKRGLSGAYARWKHKPETTQPMLEHKPPSPSLSPKKEEKDLAASPPEDAKPHPIKDFLRLHEQLFEARFRQKPAKYTGKDAKIAQRVLDRYGPDEAGRLLRSFMDADDDFMDRAGFGVNVFESQINKLVTAKHPAPPAASWRDACRSLGHHPECQSIDQHRLRETVAARGCTHPGVCRSHGEHAQRINDEAKRVAS